MDRDPNHFPTLLAACILMAIILYAASHFVYFVHQRKRLSNTAGTLAIVGLSPPPETVHEEGQYLQK